MAFKYNEDGGYYKINIFTVVYMARVLQYGTQLSISPTEPRCAN